MTKLPGILAPDSSQYICFTSGMGLLTQTQQSKQLMGLTAPDSSKYATKTDGNGKLT